MFYLTLLFFLIAVAFGVTGVGADGASAAPWHLLFVLSFLILLISLAGSLFPPRGR